MIQHIANIMTIFDFDFMRNAFLAGTIAAIIAGCVGYFIIIRHMTFAGHALSHISFAGGIGAGLINLSPVTGQLLLTLFAATSMGLLGDRLGKRDIAIGIILAFSLGLGMLFLYFYHGYSGQAMALLFGDILSVTPDLIIKMLIFSSISLLVLAFIARPLLFSSLEPQIAQAKGISLRFISVLFLLIVAVAVTEVSQVVGILLVFALLVGPGASAQNWTSTFWAGLLLTIILAIAIVWLGLLLSFITDWPTSFWISSISLVSYLISEFA